MSSTFVEANATIDEMMVVNIAIAYLSCLVVTGAIRPIPLSPLPTLS
ncbi:hypothetical protein [Sutcliffiella cohnii]|nr:hypothetical protein [Sutcliffiella cohnii]